MINYYTHVIFNQIGKLISYEGTDRKIIRNTFNYIKPVLLKTRKNYLKKLDTNNGIILESEHDLYAHDELFIERLVKLNEQNYLNESEIQSHIESMIIGGTDTMNISLCNAIMCFAMHHDVQERCYKEISDVLENDNNDFIDLNSLNKMQYFGRTLKEAQRLLPTSPLIARKARKDIKLGNECDCLIQKLLFFVHINK